MKFYFLLCLLLLTACTKKPDHAESLEPVSRAIASKDFSALCLLKAVKKMSHRKTYKDMRRLIPLFEGNKIFTKEEAVALAKMVAERCAR